MEDKEVLEGEEDLFAEEMLELINGKSCDLVESEGKMSESNEGLSQTTPKTKAKTLRLINENEDIFGVKDKPINRSKESNISSKVKELFGELSDEDMDSNHCLTKEGKLIADNLMTNESKSIDLFGTNSNKPKSSWTKKSKNTNGNANDDSIRDIFSGIRLINPMISSNRMKELMSGRKMIKMSLIKSNINHSSNDIDGDWVTIGVVISKSTPKTSKNGKQFSIWKLTDMKTKSVVSFFLFGKVYTEHWKLPVSSVIGLLNAKLIEGNRDSKYKQKEICSLTVDNRAQLLLMGTAKDMGYCKAVKKNQEICGALINLSEEDYCVYHIRTAYKKMSSSRPELQTTFSNIEPKKYSFNSNSGLFANGFNESESKDLPIIETKAINKSQLKDKRDKELETLSKVMKNPISKAAQNLALSVNEAKISDKIEKSAAISAKDVFNSIKRERNNLGFTQFSVPTLAKGHKRGQMVDLSSKCNAKLKAIQLLKAKPIETIDPNAIRKAQNKRSLDKIKSKIDSELNGSSDDLNCEERRAKKLKNDLIVRALSRKSLHDNEVEIAETKEQQKYFTSLERKEKMENKLSETLEIECVAISCHNCKYTAHSASELCKKSGHKLVRHSATKRFFKCKNCKNRSFAFNALLPSKPCSKCGQTAFDKTSIVNIKSETSLLDQKLLIRGEEKKFINS